MMFLSDSGTLRMFFFIRLGYTYAVFIRLGYTYDVYITLRYIYGVFIRLAYTGDVFKPIMFSSSSIINVASRVSTSQWLSITIIV